jgi:hypothetical protein
MLIEKINICLIDPLNELLEFVIEYIILEEWNCSSGG